MYLVELRANAMITQVRLHTFGASAMGPIRSRCGACREWWSTNCCLRGSRQLSAAIEVSCSRDPYPTA